MNLIVFVDKEIGFDLLQGLLELEDELLVVIGNNNREAFIKFLEENKIRYIFIEMFNPKSFKDNQFDWLVNLWGPKIFKEDDLRIAIDSLNVHPSYLPYARGKDPIVHSLLNKFPVGFTFHKITMELDGGPIYYQKVIPVEFPFNGGEIYVTVSKALILEFKQVWPSIRNGQLSPSFPSRKIEVINNRAHTESLRIRNYDQMASEEKQILEWICAFDFNDLYTAQFIKGSRVYSIRVNIRLVEDNG